MNTQQSLELHHVDLERLQFIATTLVQHLPESMIIGLVGTLGAGKTKLVQLLVQAASGGAAEVTSPTFTLVQSYAGTPPVHHLDAYRVADEDEFLELGVEELFDDEAWTIVEWADRVRSVMPHETLWIRLRVEADEYYRTISFNCARSETTTIVASVVGPSIQVTDS